MADSMVIVKLENLNTNETADLMLFFPSGNVAAGTSIPMGFKNPPTSGSATVWMPGKREKWAIRDIIHDGTITGGIIQMRIGTSPSNLVCILTAQGPTNPGRAKFAQVMEEGYQYSFVVVTQVTHS